MPQTVCNQILRYHTLYDLITINLRSHLNIQRPLEIVPIIIRTAGRVHSPGEWLAEDKFVCILFSVPKAFIQIIRNWKHSHPRRSLWVFDFNLCPALYGTADCNRPFLKIDIPPS